MIDLIVDGKPVQLEGFTVRESLLAILREAGFKAVKEGCATGDCGACTVVLAEEGRYRAVCACLMPTVRAAGREIWSAAGIAPHPVQAALTHHGGSQCGFCSPGFAMRMFAAYYAGEITNPEALSGNLCRCTGYLGIREAAQSLGSPDPEDPWLTHTGAKPLKGYSYAHRDERYFAPATLDEALELYGLYPEARWLGGGTDLFLELNLQEGPLTLIDLEGLAELKTWREDSGGLELGAGLTIRELQRGIGPEWAPLSSILARFALPQVNELATLGGNLLTASPKGDLMAPLLALDAELRLVSAAGERRIELADFLLGYRQTAIQKGEILVSVWLPRPPEQRYAWGRKVAKRSRADLATLVTAFVLEREGHRLKGVRLAFGGAGPVAQRALQTEALLTGQEFTGDLIEAALVQLAQELAVWETARGGREYRIKLAQNLLAEFLEAALGA